MMINSNEPSEENDIQPALEVILKHDFDKLHELIGELMFDVGNKNVQISVEELLTERKQCSDEKIRDSEDKRTSKTDCQQFQLSDSKTDFKNEKEIQNKDKAPLKTDHHLQLSDESKLDSKDKIKIPDEDKPKFDCQLQLSNIGTRADSKKKRRKRKNNKSSDTDRTNASTLIVEEPKKTDSEHELNERKQCSDEKIRDSEDKRTSKADCQQFQLSDSKTDFKNEKEIQNKDKAPLKTDHHLQLSDESKLDSKDKIKIPDEDKPKFDCQLQLSDDGTRADSKKKRRKRKNNKSSDTDTTNASTLIDEEPKKTDSEHELNEYRKNISHGAKLVHPKFSNRRNFGGKSNDRNKVYPERYCDKCNESGHHGSNCKACWSCGLSDHLRKECQDYWIYRKKYEEFGTSTEVVVPCIYPSSVTPAAAAPINGGHRYGSDYALYWRNDYCQNQQQLPIAAWYTYSSRSDQPSASASSSRLRSPPQPSLSSGIVDITSSDDDDNDDNNNHTAAQWERDVKSKFCERGKNEEQLMVVVGKNEDTDRDVAPTIVKKKRRQRKNLRKLKVEIREESKQQQNSHVKRSIQFADYYAEEKRKMREQKRRDKWIQKFLG